MKKNKTIKRVGLAAVALTVGTPLIGLIPSFSNALSEPKIVMASDDMTQLPAGVEKLQYGVTNIELKDSNGHIYPVGTKVVRGNILVNQPFQGTFCASYDTDSLFRFARGVVDPSFVTPTTVETRTNLGPSLTSILVNEYADQIKGNQYLIPTANFTTDKTKLVQAINNANQWLNGDLTIYLEQSIQDVKDALVKAQQMNDNPIAQQPEIDNCVVNLTAKIDKAEQNGLSLKNDLQTLVDQTSTLMKDTSVYTEQSIGGVQSTLTVAKNMLPKLDKTRIKSVQTIINDLYTTTKNLVRKDGKPVTPISITTPSQPTTPTVNKTSLTTAITSAKSAIATPADYTSASVAAVNSAITSGQAVLDNTNATQAQVDAAITALQNAVKNLVKTSGQPTNPNVPVNMDALRAIIKKANAVLQNSSIYTDDSVDALKNAVTRGQAVADYIEANQKNADEATNQIQTALNNLVKKPGAPIAPTGNWTYTPFKAVGYINYVPGYGIAMYTAPNGAFTGKRLMHGTAWKIIEKATSKDGSTFYKVGKDQWIRAANVSFTPVNYVELSGVVTIKYKKGYGVNLWKSASVNGGYYAGRKLMHGTSWKVFGKQNGFYRIGGNQWVQGDYATYKK
ncbi:FIVAR domain-containing protein [Xylocopilactobacillus apis]|uniref:S-layer protein C-terminal domain-containing protein n=1 Tax=Xylocopilactobacillus apis TaxID=2932183 RepID=A0AAU9DNQ7_9LACO|nr:FIVAR domain-containing protein [Xylocopilactobacillus apis]BDR56588.1 hypothetical protein KIMC2_11500 [Xylocopilactobacillus apis]